MDYFSSWGVELRKKDWGQVVDCDYFLDFFWNVEWADVAGLPDRVRIYFFD